MNEPLNSNLTIFLSIEGTAFECMEFMVPDREMTVSELIDLIVQKFNLPREDGEGFPIQYMLARSSGSAHDLKIMIDNPETCLNDSGIRSNQHLTLLRTDGCVGKGNGTQPDIDCEGEPVLSHHATGREANGDSVFDRSASVRGVRHLLPKKTSLFKRLINHFSRNEVVNTTLFAPYETERGEVMTVQVLFYEDFQYNEVRQRAKMVDPHAEEKNNQVIGVPLRRGDVLTVQLSFFCPETEGKLIIIEENSKQVTWNSNVEDATFSVFVDSRYLRKLLNGKVVVMLKDIPILEMAFNVRIVDGQKKSSALASIRSQRLDKVFISYSHADVDRVQYISETCRATKCDYFFDRHDLAPGDRYPEKIFHYIDNANLFILCWSENAAVSEWVEKERKRALENLNNNNLRIYPISIPPRAELPDDMKDTLCFGELS